MLCGPYPIPIDPVMEIHDEKGSLTWKLAPFDVGTGPKRFRIQFGARR